MDDTTTATDRQGMWSMIKQGYEGLVMTVIRPMRAIYSMEELGPKRLLLGDTVTERQDLQLKNPAGYTLECSWWKPKRSSKTAATKLPCIVVLHGNSSCRLGSLEIVTFAIPAGFTVFALDFSGSGLSQGKYVSLGYHEQADIETVVKHLRASGEISSICLWGRSMGAVASLLYAQQDSEISAMVLDSPFSSLPQLAVELVDDGKLGVPKIAVKLVMRLIRRDIKRRAKFDMFKLKPIDKVHKCTIPAFFVVGLQDELVGPHHIEAMYKLHNGPNQLFQFPGGHNSPRPINFFVQALQFLRVMVGLLPLPSDAFRDVEAPSSPRRGKPGSPSKAKAPVKVFKNPLQPGVSVESVHQMSVKELKHAIATVGYGDVPCVEKSDLIDLVLKLHQRHVRTRQHADQYSTDDLSSSLSESPTTTSTTTTKKNPSIQATKSGEAPVHPTDAARSVEKPRRYSDGSVIETTPTTSLASPECESKPFPMISGLSSASVLSDIELSLELSGDHGAVLSDGEERASKG